MPPRTDNPPPADSDPAQDDPQTFASDLRRLRLQSDNPTLARLQAETGISRTVLSDAFSGKQLPSSRTVDGIVRTCGGDVEVWHARRDALAGLRAASPSPAAEPPTEDAPSASPAAGVSRRVVAAIAAAAFVLGAGIAIPSTAAIVTAQPVEERVQISVPNGADPAKTPCVDDAAVATGDSRAENSLLEIVWSDKCQAGWGRVTRYDGLHDGNTVSISIFPQTSPDGPDRQSATEHDVQGAYTTLVVRPSPDTLLCAEGSISVEGEEIHLGEPLCI